MNRTRVTVLLLLSLWCIVRADYFLREPEFLEEPEGRRHRRAVSEWQTKWRVKARSFGQSPEEQKEIQGYIERLNAVVDERYPSKEHSKPEGEVQKQLESWNNRRMADDALSARNPEENRRHFEGDIVLFADQAEHILSRNVEKSRRRVKRKFIGSKVRRWNPKEPIFYSFDGSHTQREQKVIELALEHWHNITCLNFQRKDDEPKGNRIVFTDVDGCASNVGKHPLGEPQFVSLAPECIRLGVIAHEVAHALGFWHEQSRPDRDSYVNVRWENIDRDSKGQFLKEQPADVDTGNVPYDLGSIMHYRSKAFAQFDDLFTLNTFISDYQRTIGQRDQLSFNDIRLMNTIYCKNTCPKQLHCQRGGYTDPRKCDRCRCPDGFTGKLCDQIMPGYGADCGGRILVTSKWTKISSPNYPNEFNEGQECSWLFVAPKGQQVQLEFLGEFEIYCKIRHSLCMDYLEIKNSTDFANTGMRYCCFGTPNSSILSATEDMLVLFRSFYRGGKGFQAQVRAVPAPGRWGEWSNFSTCSQTCGACGSRVRTRKCTTAFCPGNDAETQVCGRKPCRGFCNRKETEESPCTGFLSLLKGVRCKSEKTKVEECETICCQGMSVVDGECTH